jgi:hypothetical protein
MAERYNGWSNYETWNLALWIGNEENSYNYWRDQSREAFKDVAEVREGFTRHEEAAFVLADALKADITENTPELSGFYGDILTAALSDVNWYEIAKSWVDDIADDIIAEEEEAATD